MTERIETHPLDMQCPCKVEAYATPEFPHLAFGTGLMKLIGFCHVHGLFTGSPASKDTTGMMCPIGMMEVAANKAVMAVRKEAKLCVEAIEGMRPLEAAAPPPVTRKKKAKARK